MEGIDMSDEKHIVEKEENFSLFDVLLIVAKRWKMIFFSTVIAAALIGGYLYYTATAPVTDEFNKLPTEYAATVQVKIDTGASTSAAVLASSGLAQFLGSGGKSAVDTEINFVISLLKGRTLARNIFEKVKEDGKLRENLSPGRIRGSITPVYNPSQGQIINIQYEDTDPQFATYMAGVVVDSIEERYKTFSQSKITYKREFLEDRIAQIEEQMKEAEERLNQFNQEQGIVGVDAENTETGLYIKELIFSEYMTKEKRHEIEAEYKNLRNDVDHYRKLYSVLMQQLEGAKIEELDRSQHFQVIEPPVSIGKIRPNRKLIAAVIIATTLALGILIAFVGNYLDRVKADPEESKKYEELKQNLFGSRKEEE